MAKLPPAKTAPKAQPPKAPQPKAPPIPATNLRPQVTSAPPLPPEFVAQFPDAEQRQITPVTNFKSAVAFSAAASIEYTRLMVGPGSESYKRRMAEEAEAAKKK